MRILHTSDWHLGMSLFGIPLIEDQRHFIKQLLHIIETEKIEGVLLAGDVFDSSVANSEAIALYNDAVTAICGEKGVPMVLIAGNHDGAARLAACRELLKASGLYVTGKLTADINPVVIGDCAIYPIPYFNIEDVRAMFPETVIPSYERAMLCLCDRIREGMDKTRKNIVVAHAFVSGAALSDSDRSAMLGTASMVSQAVFEGFDYVALGHLHRPQNIGQCIRYSGSPLPYAAGEALVEKSATIIDTADMSVQEVPIVPLHPIRVLKGPFESLFNDASPSADYIKIELTDCPASLDTLHAFKTFYPNLLAVTGKTALPEEERITLTVADIEQLTPAQMVEKFFQETLEVSPAPGQMDLFLGAMDAVLAGGDVS